MRTIVTVIGNKDSGRALRMKGSRTKTRYLVDLDSMIETHLFQLQQDLGLPCDVFRACNNLLWLVYLGTRRNEELRKDKIAC